MDLSLPITALLVVTQLLLRLQWRRHQLDTLARIALRLPPGTLVQLDADGARLRLRTSCQEHHVGV